MLSILIKNNLKELNSLTKYPSILTYHKQKGKGKLIEQLSYTTEDLNLEEDLEFTEKVDGTNIRIIILGDKFLIGTREDIIYAIDTQLETDSYGIINTMKPIAEKIINFDKSENELKVYYFELYGGNIGANKKNYSKKGNISFEPSLHLAQLEVGDSFILKKFGLLFLYSPFRK